MIPKDRTFYLEAAKANPKNKKWVMICFRNYVRVYRKEMAAAVTATGDKRLSKLS